MTATRRRHRGRRALISFALTLALAAPLLAPAALAVTSAMRFWNSAADTLPQVPLSTPSKILTADGTQLATLYLYNRTPVTYAQISPLVVQALVATEDVRFYTHPGVDARGLARAVKVTATGGSKQGGSTITQQYVKMTLAAAGQSAGDDSLAQDATEDSLWRKAREVKLALATEKTMSKDDIVTGYLNLAYYGSGAYGIQAAAQAYFSVNASDVSLAQAATLVALVNNPSRLDPTKNPDGATERRNLVLTRMVTAGYISQADADAAAAQPLTLTPSIPANGCAAGPAPMFCDWVRTQLEADPALGATVGQRRARLLEGGLSVRTTLDLSTQATAQAGVDAHVPSTGDVVATQVIVEPGTGNVQAMVTTRPYGTGDGQSVVPLATTDAFQPGSTFKAFTLLAALNAHIPLDTRLPGGDTYTSSMFDNPASGFFSNAGDGYGTNLTLMSATEHSVNTAYVQLAEKVGNAAIATAAHDAGLTSLDPGSVGAKEGSLTLGARETSPLELANAYATIAAHGLACTARGYTSIVDATGTELTTGQPSCTQVFDPAVADTAAAVLTSVTTEGTGTGAAVDGWTIAGKTGTTQNNGAAWFAGFTTTHAAAIWVGDPRGPSHPLVNVLGYKRVYGGDIPADIFASTFTPLLAGLPVQPAPAVNWSYLLTRTP